MTAARESGATLVRRFYEELWNLWKLEIADEILAPDVRFRGTLGASHVGIESFKAYFEKARTAFPDLHAEIDELICSDDAIVARLRWTATHTGEVFGIPATGRRWSYVGAGIFHIDAGRITEAWIVGDTQELWRILGAVPPASIDLGANGPREPPP